MSLIANISDVIDRIVENTTSTRDRQITASDFAHDKVTVSCAKYKLLYKLYDHCNLANTQKVTYQKTDEAITANVSEAFEKKYKEQYNVVIAPKLESFQKDITTQLISLVAIFTALSFVIFGGINVLDSLMANIKALPLLKVIFIGDLWMICMVNLFMLFVKFICRICEKPIELKNICIFLNLIMAGFLILLIGGIWIRYGFWVLINTFIVI